MKDSDSKVMPFSRNTKPASETSAEADHSPGEGWVQPSEEELRKEIVEILGEARRGLTEDSIYAAIALRHETTIYQALVQLLLDGKIEAELIDKDENKNLTSDNFKFRKRPADEEPGQTESPAEAAS
jgi:hypothetical protein